MNDRYKSEYVPRCKSSQQIKRQRKAAHTAWLNSLRRNHR